MASYVLAGKSVFFADVTLPRHGVWHADVQVDSDDAAGLSGQLELDLGPLTLKGSVSSRVGSQAGRTTLRLVGGGGGLAKTCPAKGFKNATFGVVLKDILSAAGETLAASADPGVLATVFGQWTNLARPAAQALDTLVRRAPDGTAWRMLLDGTVWVGTEAWLDSGLVRGKDYQLLIDEPEQLRQHLGVEEPTLLPGTLLAGKKVSSVVHHVTPKWIRTTAWLEVG